jgi:hypothetical protein
VWWDVFLFKKSLLDNDFEIALGLGGSKPGGGSGFRFSVFLKNGNAELN